MTQNSGPTGSETRWVSQAPSCSSTVAWARGRSRSPRCCPTRSVAPSSTARTADARSECPLAAIRAALLEHADRDDPVFGAGYARVLNASRPLLRAAQESGEIRTHLTLEQILDMVAAIAKIPGDAGYREPILDAALDALRPAKDG